MACRQISGLIWAKSCGRPKSIPVSRPRGRKAAGVRYERQLAAAVPQAQHGQWFEFQDRAGLGWCQADLLLKTKVGIAVLEAKYTWTPDGHKQVERLYIPVVEKVYNCPAFGMVVCRVLTSDTPRDWIRRDLATALERAACCLPTVLHWIGAGLGPLQANFKPPPLASSLASL